MTTGEKIKKARKAAGLTQKQLADSLGVSESFVSQYESGKREPKYQTLVKLAAALGLPNPAHLMFDPLPPENEKSPAPDEGEAKQSELNRLFEAADPWVQEQIMSMLRAAESAKQAQGGGK